MSTIQTIDVNCIDPDSTINVRRQGAEENVQKVKESIQQHGYWPDQPIIVRPHPDPKSEYDYQNVTGQCRLKARLALGLEEIPAFILELNDDEAIQQDLKKMVDQGALPTRLAVPIVRNTYDGSRFKQSQDAMRSRASWILGFDRDTREHAIKAIEQLGHSASIADLNANVTKRRRDSRRVVEYAIPTELYDDLLEWGQERGLDDEQTIIGKMVADALRR